MRSTGLGKSQLAHVLLQKLNWCSTQPDTGTPKHRCRTIDANQSDRVAIAAAATVCGPRLHRAQRVPLGEPRKKTTGSAT
jgi:hypothetical protein